MLRRVTLLLCAGLSLLACAKEPILYPNDTLHTQGEDLARADVAECERQADDFAARADSRVADTAKDTAVGAGAGAAAGAVGGLIRGGAGVGAAIGAASGATYSLVRALFRKRDPDPIKRRFVERCLADLGYEVAGWR